MSFVTYEKNGRVAVVTLNRPESRNAFATPQDCDDVANALKRANDDRDITALILTGAGKSFCAGGDLKSMRDRTGIGPQSPPDATRANYRNGIHNMIRTLAEVEVATIAAINGHAIGLGLDIGVICDMRLAGASAKMASSFAKMGLIPGDGGAWILTNAIGSARAAELVLTGDTIDAEEACRIGLVSRVVPDDQLMSEARKLAERVAVNPPRAIRLAKRLLREAQHGRLSDVMELSAALQALAHETADHKEAVAAFTEKRAPNFTGTDAMTIRVGIGGWSYEPWDESFYPAKLAKTKQLEYAASKVTAIEINATFYRTQSAASFQKWAAATPDDFMFSVKAPRAAVQRKDLREAKDSIDWFFKSGVGELGAKLGPIMWQLPPYKKFDAAEMTAYFDMLPETLGKRPLRHALEVRHASFADDAFLKLAHARNIAVACVESEKHPLIADPTADFAYARLELTQSNEETGYPKPALKSWAKKAREWEKNGDVFLYFISGAKERNPAAAQAMLQLLKA